MTFLLSVTAWIGHVVLWVAFVSRSHAYAWPRRLVDALTIASGVAIVLLAWPLAQFSWRGALPTQVDWIAWVPDPLATGYGLLCVGVAMTTALHGLWRWRHPERRGGLLSQRVSPIPLGGRGPKELVVAGVPRLLASLPGNQVLSPVVVEKELAIPNLPAQFDGLRIVHLSDLHMSGRIGQGFYDAIVDQSNDLAPDIVAVTGDIVERESCLDWIDQSLSRLRATEAKLFVLGNHDLKAKPPEIRRRMVAHRFEDVGGTWKSFTWGAGDCLVVGNEMPWFPPEPHLSDAPPADPGVFRLALLHTPDLFAWAQQHQFHLALAGHNHGGQIRLPGIGPIVSPSKFGTRYAAGLFETGGTVMHVSQGSGSLAPLRWNCPPELTLLTLRR